MTGITDEMVSSAPKFYEVAKQVVELTADAVFVAHNARFDYGFIREEFQRLGYTYTRKQLCTVRLARQAFPGLKKYGLDALVRHFGIQMKERHRAMADTLATTQVFEYILQQQDSSVSITDMLNQGIRESRLPPGITLDFLHSLPEETGVYYFHDADGHVVYVGKSINIRTRVMQHFAEISTKSNKLQQSVRDITYEITGSELAALLLENQEIKNYMPRINHAQKRSSYPFALYVEKDEHGYLGLHIQKIHRIPEEGREILQEYTSRDAGKAHLRTLVKQFSLCLNKTDLSTGPGACFNRHIGQCYGACIREEEASDYNDRILDVIASVSKNLKGSCMIIDTGRRHDERAVIAVVDGHFKGMGYLDDGQSLSQLSEVLDHVKSYPETPEAMKIIHSYLLSRSVERVVKW
jgi:DNA polymerase-3 subunit epsilon